MTTPKQAGTARPLSPFVNFKTLTTPNAGPIDFAALHRNEFARESHLLLP
jgi:hypothetical protein